MSNCGKYPRKTDPKPSDLNFFWDSEGSQWAVTSFSNMLALYQANLVFPAAGRPEPNTQYSAPSVNDFDIQIALDPLADNEDVHLILTPSTSFVDGAITLPINTGLRDKQIVIMNTTQQITNFSINLNGSDGVHGAPTSMGADDYFTIKYDLTVNTWYRIG
jgi:hypothetical protein